MSNNEWITDRRPINDDEEYVFNQFGDMVHYLDIKQGEPWMRIERPAPYVKPKHHFIIDIVQEWANDYGLEFRYTISAMTRKTMYEIIRRAPISIDLTGMDCETPELKKTIFDTFTETFDEIEQAAEARKMKCVGIYPLTVYPHVYFYLKIDESLRYKQSAQCEKGTESCANG